MINYIALNHILFVRTHLHNNSIPNENCEYLYVFKLKGVQKSFTLFQKTKGTNKTLKKNLLD
jgi:hypothetical protein